MFGAGAQEVNTKTSHISRIIVTMLSRYLDRCYAIADALLRRFYDEERDTACHLFEEQDLVAMMSPAAAAAESEWTSRDVGELTTALGKTAQKAKTTLELRLAVAEAMHAHGLLAPDAYTRITAEGVTQAQSIARNETLARVLGRRTRSPPPPPPPSRRRSPKRKQGDGDDCTSRPSQRR